MYTHYTRSHSPPAFIAPPAPPDGLRSSFAPPWPAQPCVSRVVTTVPNIPINIAPPRAPSPPAAAPPPPVTAPTPVNVSVHVHSPPQPPYHKVLVGDPAEPFVPRHLSPAPMSARTPSTRSLSPLKSLSPPRKALPPRTASPPRRASPTKSASPPRNVSARSLSPLKSLSPLREVRCNETTESLKPRFAPHRRYPTTYIDKISEVRPRTHAGTIPANRKDGYFGMPPQQCADPAKFAHVKSRWDKQFRDTRLKKGEVVILRNTRLCYHENKNIVHRCDHFRIAREVKQAEVERRQLLRLQRLVEVGDHRPTSLWQRSMHLRSKVRRDANRSLEESQHYLDQLDNLADPMDDERERAYWRMDVARQRLSVADAMDDIDLMLEMDDDARGNSTRRQDNDRVSTKKVDAFDPIDANRRTTKTSSRKTVSIAADKRTSSNHRSMKDTAKRRKSSRTTSSERGRTIHRERIESRPSRNRDNDWTQRKNHSEKSQHRENKLNKGRYSYAAAKRNTSGDSDDVEHLLTRLAINV